MVKGNVIQQLLAGASLHPDRWQGRSSRTTLDDHIGLWHGTVTKNTYLGASLPGCKSQFHTPLAMRPQQLFNLCAPQFPYLYNGHKNSTHCMGCCEDQWVVKCLEQRSICSYPYVLPIIDLVIPLPRTHPKEIMQKNAQASCMRKLILVLIEEARLEKGSKWPLTGTSLSWHSHLEYFVALKTLFFFF